MSYLTDLKLEIKQNPQQWKRGLWFALGTLVIPLTYLAIIPMLFYFGFLVIKASSQKAMRYVLYVCAFLGITAFSLFFIVLTFAGTWFIGPLGLLAVGMVVELVQAISANHEQIKSVAICCAYLYPLYALYIFGFTFLYSGILAARRLQHKV